MSEAMKVDTLNEEYGPVQRVRESTTCEIELRVADAEYDRLFERVAQLEEENNRLKSLIEKMTTLLELVVGNVRN